MLLTIATNQVGSSQTMTMMNLFALVTTFLLGLSVSQAEIGPDDFEVVLARLAGIRRANAEVEEDGITGLLEEIPGVGTLFGESGPGGGGGGGGGGGVFGPGVPITTFAPTVSKAPTLAPTISPNPTASPTVSPKPSTAPSDVRTSPPTGTPTSVPTATPTATQSSAPSAKPSGKPTLLPTETLSASPTTSPSTSSPSSAPSSTPTTVAPSPFPTPGPTQFCLRTEGELKQAIYHASTNAYLPTYIVLCPVVIGISREIEITGKAFSLSCAAEDCTLSGKKAYRIFRGAPAHVLINGITFIDGLAIEEGPYGGAIWLSGGSMKIEDSKFLGNRAELGGAIYATGHYSKFIVSGSTFSWNVATVDGGALYATNCDATIHDSLFGYNDAELNGGAVFFADNSVGYISGSEFIFNKVPAWSKYGGGALALDKAKVTLDSSYFNDNNAPTGRDVYILDDESPEQHGSFLKCSSEYHKTVVFHDEQHYPSVVEAGSPGSYHNQNCAEVTYSSQTGYNQAPYQAHKAGYPDQAVYSDRTEHSNSDQYTPPTSSKQETVYASDGAAYPAPSQVRHPVAYPTNADNKYEVKGPYRENDTKKPAYGADYGDGYAAKDVAGHGECDTWNDWGDDSHSTNDGRYMLNTAESKYDIFHPKYDPLQDSYCFNEEYPTPYYDDLQMYYAYAHAFDEGLSDFSDASYENNYVSKNRIPGMMLRMCFHDETIETQMPKYQDYIHGHIDPTTSRWMGPFKWLETSGGDASNLMCPAERDHPNNNYEQTATRILFSLQEHMKQKFPDVSYADLLHNGCKAAIGYLDGVSPAHFLYNNGFSYGRKDACHVDIKCGAKYPLCGGSEHLPGFAHSASQYNLWFVNRGMSVCLWMSLLWTHTTIDKMGTMCPIQKIACKTDGDDVAEYPDESKLYFGAGDTLDYFSYFLESGQHFVQRPIYNRHDPNCYWEVDGQSVYWPLTAADCELSLDNVRAQGLDTVAQAITNFHSPSYNTIDIVTCALEMLGGKGFKERGICDNILPQECQSPKEHMFGSYFGDPRKNY